MDQTFSFSRIRNILYSPSMHLTIDNNFLLHNDINKLLNDAGKRIKYTDHTLNNPKYLFLSLYTNKRSVYFNTLDYNHNDKFKWIFDTGSFYNPWSCMYLDISGDKLIISKDKKCIWAIEDDQIKCIQNNQWVSCDHMYNLTTKDKDKDKGIKFWFDDSGIHYVKSQQQIGFEIQNIEKSINVNHWLRSLKKSEMKQSLKQIDQQHNLGILLIAGTSSRFHSATNKQIFELNGKCVASYSIDIMKKSLDHLIIVTNTKCSDTINQLISHHNNITLLVADTMCRMESLDQALKEIASYCSKHSVPPIDVKLVIHDGARPYINDQMITKLLDSKNMYAQYYMKLTNGLMNKVSGDFVPRDDYLEICTPLMINYKVCKFIFYNYIEKSNRITLEFIPILDILGLNYELIEGHYKDLRKITTINDIF